MSRKNLRLIIPVHLIFFRKLSLFFFWESKMKDYMRSFFSNSKSWKKWTLIIKLLSNKLIIILNIIISNKIGKSIKKCNMIIKMSIFLISQISFKYRNSNNNKQHNNNNNNNKYHNSFNFHNNRFRIAIKSIEIDF